jgi:hypothetical protein
LRVSVVLIGSTTPKPTESKTQAEGTVSTMLFNNLKNLSEVFDKFL